MGVDVGVGRQGLSLKVLYDCSYSGGGVRRHATLEVVSDDGETFVAVGSTFVSGSCFGALRIAFRAALGFLLNSFRRDLPYLILFKRLVCLMVRLVARRWAW